MDFTGMTDAHKRELPKTSQSLPIALIQARESIMAPIREMLVDCGLTEQQWRVLRVLAEFGPQDAKQLAERACLLPPSLTRITRTMCNQGLMKQDQDRQDRRRQKLAITANGQQIIAHNRTRALDIVDDYKKRLGEKDYNTLLDLLGRMANTTTENPGTDDATITETTEYLSKPLASVGWQENRFREPQNTEVFEDHRNRFDATDDED